MSLMVLSPGFDFYQMKYWKKDTTYSFGNHWKRKQYSNINLFLTLPMFGSSKWCDDVILKDRG
jgi:hypothetical protein